MRPRPPKTASRIDAHHTWRGARSLLRSAASVMAHTLGGGSARHIRGPDCRICNLRGDGCDTWLPGDPPGRAETGSIAGDGRGAEATFRAECARSKGVRVIETFDIRLLTGRTKAPTRRRQPSQRS